MSTTSNKPVTKIDDHILNDWILLVKAGTIKKPEANKYVEMGLLFDWQFKRMFPG
jgi:hypothetical protein